MHKAQHVIAFTSSSNKGFMNLTPSKYAYIVYLHIQCSYCVQLYGTFFKYEVNYTVFSRASLVILRTVASRQKLTHILYAWISSDFASFSILLCILQYACADNATDEC